MGIVFKTSFDHFDNSFFFLASMQESAVDGSGFTLRHQMFRGIV
jgi:hypothetical protein